MAAMKARNLSAGRDFTHSLSITLGGPSFVSQFQTSLQRFQEDASETVPEKAYYPPELWTKVYLGKLHLGTRNRPRISELSTVLQDLNYRRLLGGPAVERSAYYSSSSSSSSLSASDIKQAYAAHSSVSHVAPLKFDLSGIKTTSIDPSKALTLHLLPSDPTGRWRRFCQAVAHYLAAAGFPLVDGREPSIRFVNSLFVHWNQPQGSILLKNGATKYKKPRFNQSAFDARRLIKEYENKIWVKDVELERLCVYEMNATKKLPDGSRVLSEPQEVAGINFSW